MSTIRDTVFNRDNGCRVCRGLFNEAQRRMFNGGRLEWAHLQARGMGGTPDGRRDTTANTICCCAEHHRGVRSLHSGHLEVIPLTDAGADGPIAVVRYEKLPKADLGLLKGVTL